MNTPIITPYAYWDQWDHDEHRSMHGLDIVEDNEDDHDDTYHIDDQDDCQDDSLYEPEGENLCCSGCMFCLDLSW